jgi:ubiquinone/menaquinone biosynthesis C-methylase UbiE
MPEVTRPSDYSQRLEAEARKWGHHLELEKSGHWHSWLEHPLIKANYQKRSLIRGKTWPHWLADTLGGPATRSLDLGCGTGGTSRVVYDAGASSYVEGYDVSSERVAVAEEKRIEQAIPGRFMVADVNRLELPENTYDLIFSSQSFHHFLDLEKVIAEVKKALTPGGFFVLEEYMGPTQFQWPPAQTALARACLAGLPERLRISVGDQVKQLEGRPAPAEVEAESPFESIRSGEIARLFRQHFDVVEERRLGGYIQHLLHNGIVHHFALDDAEAIQHLEGIMAVENCLTDLELIPSDFMLMIGRVPR